MSRRAALGLAAILGVALLLRLWGIDYGLPYDLTADEPHQIVQALKIGTGSGGPLVRMWHTIGKGGLDYLLFLEYGALFAFWWLTGRVDGPQAFALQYLTDPTAFYLVGRITVAALGALTCVALFYAGRRMYDTRVGLGAAFLAAVSYYHASASHVINVHIPMTFALWAGVAAYLSYEQTRRRRTLVVAGLLCGAGVALAYSAAIGVLLVLCAILFLSTQPNAAARVKDAAIFSGAALVSVALMSPDLLTGAALLIRNFTTSTTPQQGDVRSAIDSVTILRQQNWTGFASLLVKPDTLMATLGAIVGMAVGLWRRERWAILLSVTAAAFVLLVSSSNRGLNESYLLPVIPALWLLSSRGVAALTRDRRWLYAAGMACIGATSLFVTMREDVMLAKPDTRVVAKQWIETHVPPGAKILMDGMRFRFVQGVPLNADKATLARRMADLEKSELTLSNTMLQVYRQAAERTSGPTYDLHSTVYGLEVEDLDHYVAAGFDYVVVSSFNEKRYASDTAKQQHPKSAKFYGDIKRDPRFQAVYVVEPLMWQQVGPTITVYRVIGERAVTDGATTS